MKTQEQIEEKIKELEESYKQLLESIKLHEDTFGITTSMRRESIIVLRKIRILKWVLDKP